MSTSFLLVTYKEWEGGSGLRHAHLVVGNVLVVLYFDTNWQLVKKKEGMDRRVSVLVLSCLWPSKRACIALMLSSDIFAMDACLWYHLNNLRSSDRISTST